MQRDAVTGANRLSVQHGGSPRDLDPGTAAGLQIEPRSAADVVFSGDTFAPQLFAVESTDLTTVVVSFTETVETTSAETAGNYVITGGWPSDIATHTGPDWLNVAPTGKHIEMRVMDFYRIEDGLIAEEWVLGNNFLVLVGLGFQLTPPHFEVIEGARETPEPDPEAGR